MKKQKKNSGQVVLIVLLASAAIMTLGLSLSKKATVETRVDTDEELLKQSFNAAESGVEYYLATGKDQYQTTDGKSIADVVVDENLGNGDRLDFNEFVLPNTNDYFWLVGHEPSTGDITTEYYGGGSVNVCLDSTFDRSVKIDYFYLEGGNYKVSRWGYNFGAGQAVNNYDNPDPVWGTCGGDRKKIVVNMTGNPLLLVVTPIFKGSKIVLEAANPHKFPAQGVQINSTGRSGDLSSMGVNTSIKVLNRYKVPSFMLEAITAAGEIK